MIVTLIITDPFYLICGVLIAHYVGDFVFQSRWMGDNKSKDNVALLAHVIAYGVVLGIGGTILFGPVALKVWLPINATLHLWVDWLTSRLSSEFYRAHRPYAFWNTIGADQLVHGVTLILTTRLLMTGWLYGE